MTQGSSTDAPPRIGAGLEETFRGALLRPEDPGYDEARGVWNGMIDRRPALIAQCTGTADVIAAVNVAREEGLLVAVRGGGHQVAGTAVCDDGIMIDLSPMKAVQVEPGRRLVMVQGGATFAELDRETQVHGLATPGGVVSETGVAGLTLGGGIGWLRRKHGLSVDNLVSVELVTADGEVVTASKDENEELFWGVRGGGGNFGIVTSFEFQMHEVGPEVMFCAAFHAGDSIDEALRFYDEWCASAPDEVTSFAICGTAPSEDPFPEHAHGKPFVLFAACCAGDPEAGRELVAPLRSFAEPLVDLSGVMPYTEVQSFFDEDYPKGELRYYWKSLYLDDLGDEAIATIVKYTEDCPSPLSTIDVWQLGGKASRIAEDSAAFPGRDAAYMIGIEGNWESADDDDANIAWARDLMDDLQQYSDGVEYVNFPGFQEGGIDTLRTTFGQEKLDRLIALKDRYDPANLFRLNQNIPPS